MVNGQIGIGIVGAGESGQNGIDAFSALPEVNIVAVMDADPARARLMAAHYSARTHPTLERLLDDPYVNVVALFTPPHQHAQQALAAVNAGKHVFCDAPLALSLEQAEAIYAAAAHTEVRVAVNHVLRFNLFYATAAAIRHDGVLGALHHIDLTDYTDTHHLPADHWFHEPDRNGGIWLAHTPPFWDAFMWLAGARARLLGAQRFGTPTSTRAQAIARCGDTAIHAYHAFEPGESLDRTILRLAFEFGVITLREWMPTVIEIATWTDTAPLMVYLPGSVTPEKRDGKMRRLRAFAPQGKDTVLRECLQASMSNLLNAVRDPARPLTVTPDDVRASLSMALAAAG